jgi:hypothetical protein
MSHPASRTLWAIGLALVAVVVGLAAVLALGPNGARAVDVQPGPAAATTGHHVVRGADVSWPNCPKGEGIPSRRTKGEPMPRRSARFVIVGLTNGPGFHPNPCIARQLAWVADHHRQVGAYAMTTYPTARQIRRNSHAGPFVGTGRRAALRNTGYAEAMFNIRTMSRVGLQVPTIWVDVEPYPVAPWTRHHRLNRAVISGAIRGYQNAWATAGHGNVRQALAMCTYGPSGGLTWLAQWYDPHRDYDVTCPAASGGSGGMLVRPAARS